MSEYGKAFLWPSGEFERHKRKEFVVWETSCEREREVV